MVRVEIVRDITVLTSPCLESFKLTLGLAHITIEVIEVAQVARLRSRVRVRRIKPFVMLDEYKHAVLPRLVD